MTVAFAFGLLTAGAGLSPSPRLAVGTRMVRADSSLSAQRDGDGEARRAWDHVVAGQLIPWANGDIDMDDDLIRPSLASIQVAERFVRLLRDQGSEPPTAVLPDGDGGIVFEQRLGLASVQFQFLSDGDVEFVQYDERGLVRHDFVRASSLA